MIKLCLYVLCLCFNDCNVQVNAWAASKMRLGQFYGSTEVRILTVNQLGPEDARFSAWAKKVCLSALLKLITDFIERCFSGSIVICNGLLQNRYQGLCL